MKNLIFLCALVFSYGAQAQQTTDCSQIPNMARYVPECQPQGAAEQKNAVASSLAHSAIAVTWANEYLACANSNVAGIDDGYADVNAVASGLHSRCKSVYPTAQKSLKAEELKEMTISLRKNLLDIVALHRSTQWKEKPSKQML